MADSPETGTETPRLRVHQVAKELGITSRDLLSRLADEGLTVKSPQSVLAADVVARLRGDTSVAASATSATSATDTQTSPPEADADVADAPAAAGLVPQVLFVSPSDAPVKATRRRRPAVAAEASADNADSTATPATDGTDSGTDVDAPATGRRSAAKSGSGRAPAKAGARATKAPAKSGGRTAKAGGRAAKATDDASADDKGVDPTSDSISDVVGDLEPAADAAPDLNEPDDLREAAIEEANANRRRRRRGRRGRGGRSGGESVADGTDSTDGTDGTDTPPSDDAPETDRATGDAEESTESETGSGESSSTRRRRRRRRAGNADGSDNTPDDPDNTVVHIRDPRPEDDGVRGVKGSTRLEAKRQRRRDGRESSRRRPDILTEAEFLARREAVNRVMAVRENGKRIQVAVLEDDVLVEHYVTQASATSYVGNIYLGRVQNVLPSMEAAFVDIGKGRNGVLYAGEVNWDAAGLEGKSRAIESALKSGDPVLVQVTKDPIGHKGARLTSQISLPGRFLVLVPGGGMTGISRKLPDTERHRLKSILKKIVPEDAGVIIRTAAEGASEEDLTRDVQRLTDQWEAIQKKSDKTKSAPSLVHGEPDLAIRVVRDVFNEDFKKLVVQGEESWSTVNEYIGSVAPDLVPRLSRYTGEGDLFHDLRVDEQLTKALDRKVWLPSGGSLVIDRTEAMTVVDVNTGKFVGSGGNLEETVTRNNLEAAEEIVRQLRLRDIGGIVVIDFIDMVLESNRQLVLRRLTECLGRDRTKHQVAEVTSLGLVQMTRKRVGEGLLEAFSEPCPNCHGRGVLISTDPVDRSQHTHTEEEPKAKRGKRGAQRKAVPADEEPEDPEIREKRLAAMAAIHKAASGEEGEDGDVSSEQLARFDEAAVELQMGAVAEVLDSVTVAPRRSRGRGRGTAAASVPAESSRTSELADSSEPAESSASSEPASPSTPVRSEAPEPTEPTDQTGASAPEPATADAAAPRPRRRRRAASRPAGPPAAVNT